MTKCNILGRGEARYSKQLEKAKEKIINLKVLLDAYNLIGKVFLWPLDCQLCGHCQERIQELETSAELKDNAILRSLKVSNITGCLKNPESNSSYNSDLLSADKISAKELGKQILTPHSKTLLRIISYCGIYEYLSMPFGIEKAPPHYQKMMNTIFPHEL